MNGIINVNKPVGITSFQVVALVKKLTGEKKAGHAGTLDPDACGILPVCLARATHVIPFIMDDHKTYHAEIELGISTNTYDRSGDIVRRSDCSNVTLDDVMEGLSTFSGWIEQTPPMYSAIKYRGQPLYKLAREGITIDRKSRPTRIDSLQVSNWQSPLLTIDVVCGKGTYIRSLAHDLGQKLGCGACLRSLIRTACGPFIIDNAVSLSDLREASKEERISEIIFPVDFVLQELKELTVTAGTAEKIIHGIDFTPVVSGEQYSSGNYRVYSEEGKFLAIASFDIQTGSWHPRRVFSD